MGRKDEFNVKRERAVEDGKNGQKEGKFIWYGMIRPGKEVVLVSKWDAKARFDVEWKVESG